MSRIFAPTVFPTTATQERDVALRVNQVGYRPLEPKVGLALSREDLHGQTFQVLTDSGAVALEGQVGKDRGPYGSFAHLYEIDFSSLDQTGRYCLALDKNRSVPFQVDDAAFQPLIAPTLDFFEVQKCGAEASSLHGPCHVEDGVAASSPEGSGDRSKALPDGHTSAPSPNGPAPVDAPHVNAVGGWHDAGDYIKFMVTTGVSELLMLTAWQRHPEAFTTSGESTPLVLREAKVGLDWMLGMWDPTAGVLYHQVGDESDHEHWRMPEQDQGARPVWACEPGRGANVAGKTAASLALAYTIFNDRTKDWYDPDRAARYLEGAQQIYDWGKSRPLAQSTNPSNFYPATTTDDDMALAAAELYRATGQAQFLQEAKQYAAQAGSAPFDVDDVHALAHYELGRLDPSYRSTAVAALASDLEPLRKHAQADPFHAAPASFGWGSVERLTASSLEAKWYEDLTNDPKYRDMAQQQRDYILGCNPWGVSLVSGTGTVWPHHPHHQIADLRQAEIPGIWAQGPCRMDDWNNQGITLSQPDVYADLQTPEAVFHDDVRDYVCNEPSINTNALGLAMTSWFIAPPPTSPVS